MSFLSRAFTGSPELRAITTSAAIPLPSEDMAAYPTPEGNAMALGAFYACVTLLADTVASLTVRSYRQVGDARIEVNPQPKLFQGTGPYPECTWFEWLWMMMQSLAVTGNAFGYVTARDPQNNATAIMPLHPSVVSVGFETPSGTGWTEPVYRISGQRISRDDIVHIKRYPIAGEALGMSPIQQAASAVGLGLAAERYGLTYFRDSANPSSVLESDLPLDEESTRRLQQQWVTTHGGRRRPAILSGGVRWRPIAISPEESQFLSVRQFQRSEIAMWFRVPPHMIGDTAKSTSWGCLPGDALIATTHGPVPIEDVKPGDEVFSFDGSKMLTAKVTDWKMTGHKPLITIKTRGRELRLTANHRVPVRRYFGKWEAVGSSNPMYCIKGTPQGTYQVRIRRATQRFVKTVKTLEEAIAARDEAMRSFGLTGQTGWRTIEVTADQIKTGDMLLVPHGMGDGDRRVAPNGMELTVGMMEFAGLYLGDGSRDKGRIEIAHDRDEDHLPHYRAVIKREFGADAYTDPRRHHRTRFSSPRAIELIESGFTGTAATKRIPGWVFRLAPDLQLAVLRGYLDSDGSVAKTTQNGVDYPFASFSSISKLMLEDARQLCIQLGIPVGKIHVGRKAGSMKVGDGPTYQSQIKYVLNITSPEHLGMIGSNCPRKAERMTVPGHKRIGRYDPKWTGATRGEGSKREPVQMYKPGEGFDIPGVVLHRVISVQKDTAEVPVYDIEVKGPAHYVADGVLVHNSGLEQQSVGFSTYTLRPWLTCIEQMFTALLPRDEFARFNIDGLLRGDAKSRWEAYRLGRDTGVYSVNDIRALENLPPVDDGDGRLQPMNFAPLGYVPEQPAEPTAEPDPEPTESTEDTGTAEEDDDDE